MAQQNTDNKLYEIEILRVNRSRKDGTCFFVHYVGYGTEHDSWVKHEDLDAETRLQYFKNGKLKSLYRKRKMKEKMASLKRKAKKPKHIPVRIGEEYQVNIPPCTPPPVASAFDKIVAEGAKELATPVTENLVVSAPSPQTTDINFFKNRDLMIKYRQEMNTALNQMEKQIQVKIKEEKEKHELKKAQEERKHNLELKYLSESRIAAAAMISENLYQKYVNIHNNLPEEYNRKKLDDLFGPVSRRRFQHLQAAVSL